MLMCRKVDFQTRGGGSGADYGSAAPRINVVNKHGTFLVERWKSGSTVHDYGVVLVVQLGTKVLAYVAGLRDIATRGAAFVACLTSSSYAAVFATHNAVLVAMTYPDSLTSPSEFTPTTGNCTVMALGDITSTQPIPP